MRRSPAVAFVVGLPRQQHRGSPTPCRHRESRARKPKPAPKPQPQPTPPPPPPPPAPPIVPGPIGPFIPPYRGPGRMTNVVLADRWTESRNRGPGR
ncbi:hypothetical protein B5D80_21390 [Micromonospora wenchangensis]|uniref:Uncharacterized protein n=1 Tax=Micromonospora wenchangensis TaxID=1185415 RepID=A0A246RI06_9ACTN|nr:hypothetical protein B5D80_21390 [Micromonospora wenchangensis]